MVNINCSLDCVYQHEGKCTLKQIPSNQKYGNDNNNDCVYYINEKNNSNMNK